MDGDGPHMNSFDGEEHLCWLDLVDAVAQSGGFHEEEISWLRVFVNNGQEHEAIAYLRHIIAERHYTNYDNSVSVEDNLDSEGEDQDADDELPDHIGVYQHVIDHPLWLRHHGPPDIFDRESDTDSEDEAPMLSPSSRPVPGGSSRWLRYCEVSDISDWESDTEEEDPASRARDQDGEDDERAEERRHRPDFVEEIVQSGRFSERANAWLRLVVSHRLEHKSIAYLRNYIAEHDNIVIAKADLDSEDEDQESDDEAQGYMSDWGGDSDDSTDHEAPALVPSSSPVPGGSRRWLRGQDEDSDHMSSQQFRCSYELPSDTASDIMEENPVPAPSLGPVNEGSRGWLRHYEVSDISDWKSETDNSTDCQAPVLASSSSSVPTGSQRRMREEDVSDGWISSKRFRCCDSVPQVVSCSDNEEADPESEPSSSLVPKRSKKRAKDEDEEEDRRGRKQLTLTEVCRQTQQPVFTKTFTFFLCLSC